MLDNLLHPRSETSCSRPESMRTGLRRPWARLLAEVLQLAGSRAEFLHHAERPWSSVTFCGTRHSIALAFEGTDPVAQGEGFIAALPEHEFSIPGHLVADAAIVAVEQENGTTPRMTIEVELLLLEDV